MIATTINILTILYQSMLIVVACIAALSKAIIAKRNKKFTFAKQFITVISLGIPILMLTMPIMIACCIVIIDYRNKYLWALRVALIYLSIKLINKQVNNSNSFASLVSNVGFEKVKKLDIIKQNHTNEEIRKTLIIIKLTINKCRLK